MTPALRGLTMSDLRIQAARGVAPEQVVLVVPFCDRKFQPARDGARPHGHATREARYRLHWA